jgi:hypothetical protein
LVILFYLLGLSNASYGVIYSIIVADEIDVYPNDFWLAGIIATPSFFLSPLILWINRKIWQKRRVRFLRILRASKKLSWVYFILSVIGAFLTIWYTKTGTALSLVSIIEERLNERTRSNLKDDWEEKKDLGSLLNRVRRLESVCTSTSVSLLNKVSHLEQIIIHNPDLEENLNVNQPSIRRSNSI